MREMAALSSCRRPVLPVLYCLIVVVICYPLFQVGPGEVDEDLEDEVGGSGVHLEVTGPRSSSIFAFLTHS